MTDNNSIWVWVVLVLLAASLGFAGYKADEERGTRYREQQAIGLGLGCTEDYPIPASDNSTGEAACYRSTACDFWKRPSCKGLTLDARYLAVWNELEDRRDVLETRHGWFTGAAILIGYFVVGWLFHSLVVAVVSRFVLPKWALLVALAINLATMNGVGVVRAIVGLLKLPPRTAEA